jgi:hypothetical protein
MIIVTDTRAKKPESEKGGLQCSKTLKVKNMAATTAVKSESR